MSAPASMYMRDLETGETIEVFPAVIVHNFIHDPFGLAAVAPGWLLEAAIDGKVTKFGETGLSVGDKVVLAMCGYICYSESRGVFGLDIVELVSGYGQKSDADEVQGHDGGVAEEASRSASGADAAQGDER